MKLDYFGVHKDNLPSGLNIDKLNIGQRQKYIDNIIEKKSSDMLDWLDLVDIEKGALDEILNYADFVKENAENFIVLGIGGSALGIKMLKQTFVDSVGKTGGVRVEVLDNIDPDTIVPLLETINLEKTIFNVITKSGSTSETLSQMSIVMDVLEKNGVDTYSHMVVTTEKDNELHNFSIRSRFKYFEVPKGVGGRFSVLSPVGLLPASIMGIDIVELLKGAKKELSICSKNDNKNIAYTCAHINYEYLQAGKTNFVIMPYSERLALVPDFFAQLWGESLGKRENRKGEEVFAGQTPIKTIGVTDQHSQLQLYSEGIQDKVIMFIKVDNASKDIKTSNNIPFASHLSGVSLKELLDYEYMSTAYSLTMQDRPNYTISINEITEETMGALIIFMEMMTAFMGEMMGVNTYDQPGVELSKKLTKGCLGMAGYEDFSKEIKKYSKSVKKYTI